MLNPRQGAVVYTGRWPGAGSGGIAAVKFPVEARCFLAVKVFQYDCCNKEALLFLYDACFFFIGHRRYVKDGHWIRDAGFLIGKR